jgi:site-specific DNA-cytosine methylase
MKVLHLFSGSNNFSEVALKYGISVVSVDMVTYPGHPLPVHLCDILKCNYKIYDKAHFDFLLIGFPCTTFSKASGGFHFLKHCYPKTDAAHNSIELLLCVNQVIQYFSKAVFLIENPVSAIEKNWHFKNIFSGHNLFFNKVHQGLFGHVCFKHTVLITNSSIPFMVSSMHRVNKKYKSAKMDTLPVYKRQTYTVAFCDYLINWMFSHGTK